MSLPLRPNGSNAPRRVARLRHNDRAKRPGRNPVLRLRHKHQASARGRNPVVPLRHKHQDTPACRCHCDPTGQTRLGVSRDCVTTTGPSALCPSRCPTVASQTPRHASASRPMRHNGSNTPRRVARSRHNAGPSALGRNPVLPLRHKHQDTPGRGQCDTTGQTRLGVSRDRVINTGPSAPGRNPVVQLRHKHQDTPTCRGQCDTTGQTRLGVSRDCITNNGPSARAGTPSCPLRHKHQDTPARRGQCDTRAKPRLGVSRKP